MLYAAIDINKHSFQAAVFDPASGEVVEERFSADRESLDRWDREWRRGSRRSRPEAWVMIRRRSSRELRKR